MGHARQSILPPIIAGDVIGLLMAAFLLTSVAAWAAWLLYMLVFDALVYCALRESDPLRPSRISSSGLSLSQPRTRGVRHRALRIFLFVTFFAVLGYLIGLGWPAWILYMTITSLLIGYWHRTTVDESIASRMPDPRVVMLRESSVRLAAMLQRPRSRRAVPVPVR